MRFVVELHAYFGLKIEYTDGGAVGSTRMKRRSFLKGGLALGACTFPTIIPARVLGQEVPSKKIQVGIIGCGRIANSMDIHGVWHNRDLARIVALSDCDAKRLNATRLSVAQRFGSQVDDIKVYADYRALLADPTVDAVMLCTPEHWHAQQCVEAAFAGKDVYVQKPLAMSIYESHTIAAAMEGQKRVFHIGTQQRSEGVGTFGKQFRQAAEFVRSGRLGRLQRIEIGLPSDPPESKKAPLAQPVPSTLNYDRWLGATPAEVYSELRTHPQGKDDQVNYGRPGWMVIQNYSMGMIANWGAHHIDIAQWAMGVEAVPVAIEGHAEYPPRRLWDAHGRLDVSLRYSNGALMHIANEDTYPNGVRFIGENGWIFCSRGSAKATIADPGVGGKHGRWRPLEYSHADLVAGEPEVVLARNAFNHHRAWFEGILARKTTMISPHEACSSSVACVLAYNAMCLGRPLRWNAAKGRYRGDREANAMLARPERAPYGLQRTIKHHGWKV